ncbi:MAG: tetratricopeptide repeat protein, partial [Candidatus Omnitrophica bacterium]|nr:tetratricopeptide repeat protein [Candidatus Omnitrophota bacterium]
YRKSIFLLLSAFFILIAVFLGKYTKTYSHFQTLFFYKLLFLNNKPADPNLIPYEARILWVPALLKPGWSRVFIYFSTLMFFSLLSIVAVPYRVIKKQACHGEGFLLLGLFVFFTLYLFMARFQVYFIIFLCIFTGYGGWFLKRKFKKIYIVWLLCLVTGLCLETARVIACLDYIGIPVKYEVLEDCINWVKENTSENDVILANFGLSPPLLTYAQRAIVLHPKFESRGLRDKVKEYAFSLFSENENDFYKFCLKNKADYFVFSAGTFSDESHCGWRYITATPASARQTTAYKFEYAPEDLNKFIPVYRSYKYDIYKVLKLKEIIKAEEYYVRAGELLEEKKYEQALEQYKTVLEIFPNHYKAHLKIGLVYSMQGDKKTAARHWQRGQRIKQLQYGSERLRQH